MEGTRRMYERHSEYAVVAAPFAHSWPRRVRRAGMASYYQAVVPVELARSVRNHFLAAFR
jgi:hypothetical protein